MKNFIFKSEADFHKIVFNKLDMLLAEQRHQRADLATLDRRLNVIIHELDIEKQADEYYQTKIEETTKHMPEEQKHLEE